MMVGSISMSYTLNKALLPTIYISSGREIKGTQNPYRLINLKENL